jgi:hypothetical protein
MMQVKSNIYVGCDKFAIIKKDVIERDTFRYIKDLKKESIKLQMYNKPKRGKPWRDASTDEFESAKVIKLFNYTEGNIVNFIHKTRQIMLHNRKDMYQRTINRKRNNYSRYMEEVYKNEICILCDDNICDDREHYKTCKFSINEYNTLIDDIKNIIKRRSGNKDAVIWFGNNKEIDDGNTINEKRIEAYNKESGERFFIPIGVKEYLKEMGFKKDWQKTRDDIMIMYIRGRMTLYQKRCKEHSRILKSKQLKKEWVTGKNISISEDPLDRLPKKVKYNEIIDLTEEEPYIITDLNMKRKKIIRKTRTNSINRKRKVTPLIITGPIPLKKRRKKE